MGVCSYGLHDSFDCRANRATRSMCVLPWTNAGMALRSSDVGTLSGLSSMHGAQPWRLLTGHDSGNILMFDPALPHFKPLLTIKFPPFSGVAPVSISVLASLQLLVIMRADGMVQLMSMITPDNRIMASAIDPTQPVRRSLAPLLGPCPLRSAQAGILCMPKLVGSVEAHEFVSTAPMHFAVSPWSPVIGGFA